MSILQIAAGPDTMLGHGLDLDNARNTGLAALVFFLLRELFRTVNLSWVPGYGDLNKSDKNRFDVYLVALIHAAFVSLLCLNLVVFPDRAIENDRVYGLSKSAGFAFSVSTGFFLYDMTNCSDKLYMVHHLASALCYILVQAPFLQYYAVRFLLYEISTPFLNLRNMLLVLGKKGTFSVELAERCFGYSFLAVRICMGIPLSLMAFRDCYHLFMANQQHSTPVMLYFVIANLGLNGLNVFWLGTILAKKFAKKKTAEHKNLVSA